jgi:predicted secreted hydrolase
MNKRLLLKLVLFLLVFNPVFSSTNIQFPKDHGKHEEANTEWWSFWGHMMDANHHLFGFSLNFIRLRAPYQKLPSEWVTKDIYASYFSISDSEQQQFYYQEKINRTSFNFAGASDTQLLLWNRGWQAVMNNNMISLEAQTKNAVLNLQLKPAKPILLLGQNGFFANENLYHYAFPSLRGDGKLKLGNKEYKIVSVNAGVDHAFQIGAKSDLVWDKFIIHLNNDEDILLYIFAAKNSTFVSPESFCIINHADGTSVMLKLADFEFTQLDSWYSPSSKTTYPSTWMLTIPDYHYRLVIKPTMQNQEINTINITYWGGEGLVTGEKNGISLAGYAYVEFSKQTGRSYLL